MPDPGIRHPSVTTPPPPPLSLARRRPRRRYSVDRARICWSFLGATFRSKRTGAVWDGASVPEPAVTRIASVRLNCRASRHPSLPRACRCCTDATVRPALLANTVDCGALKGGQWGAAHHFAGPRQGGLTLEALSTGFGGEGHQVRTASSWLGAQGRLDQLEVLPPANEEVWRGRRLARPTDRMSSVSARAPSPCGAAGISTASVEKTQGTTRASEARGGWGAPQL